jgi:hypothetical protein
VGWGVGCVFSGAQVAWFRGGCSVVRCSAGAGAGSRPRRPSAGALFAGFCGFHLPSATLGAAPC